MFERMNERRQSGPVHAPLSQIGVLAAIGLAIASGSASAQCTYEVQSWPSVSCAPLGQRPYTGSGLNNLGAWCGWREACPPSEASLAIYCPPNGTPQVLAMPPNAGPKGARANAVNDAGVVVGFSYQGTSGSQEVGCIWWPDGSVTVIPVPPGASRSTPESINDSGEIAGSTGSNPFIWIDGILTIIPQPPSLGAGGARAISDTAWVAGTFGNQNQNARAFRWKDGVTELLEPLSPHPVSFAYAVNNQGWVVGASRTPSSGGQPAILIPTLWTGDATIALPMLPGYSIGAAGEINDQGVITGEIAGLPGQGLGNLPVAWINGQCHRIGDLVIAGSPSIGTIVSINGTGQMMSAASAKILTPVDKSPTDLNGDCAVDGSDLMKLLSEWGPRDWSVADLNHDGIVNGADLAQVLGNWTDLK